MSYENCGMLTQYADLIDKLRGRGVYAEAHGPQLVIRDAKGFGSPIWLTWADDWHVCAWGPTCYRVPSQNVEALCLDCQAQGVLAEVVDRYGLESVEPDALHWLGEE